MLARRIRTDGFVDPCIPPRAPKPPSGPDWVHEVKHDGYRLIVRRDGDTAAAVVFSSGGNLPAHDFAGSQESFNSHP